jgi:hypothetical protein
MPNLSFTGSAWIGGLDQCDVVGCARMHPPGWRWIDRIMCGLHIHYFDTSTGIPVLYLSKFVHQAPCFPYLMIAVHSLNLYLLIAHFMFDCPVTASARAHMYDHIYIKPSVMGDQSCYNVWICVIDKRIIHVSAGAMTLSYEACELLVTLTPHTLVNPSFIKRNNLH